MHTLAVRPSSLLLSPPRILCLAHVDALPPLDRQIDSELVRLQRDGTLRAYWMEPPLLQPQAFGAESDVQRSTLGSSGREVRLWANEKGREISVGVRTGEGY